MMALTANPFDQARLPSSSLLQQYVISNHFIANHSQVSQWEGEFSEKAPSLKVFTYPGIQNLPEDFDYDSFLEFDVILATYPVLSKEVHYATPPPDRSMRYKKIRPPRRSPLMEFDWWRVCLDEAQMIEGSVTSAATVACMLPRTVSH
jgi:E3 ubiquitin-protein ligase SHPRH